MTLDQWDQFRSIMGYNARPTQGRPEDAASAFTGAAAASLTPVSVNNVLSALQLMIASTGVLVLSMLI